MKDKEFTAIGVDIGGTKMAFGTVTFPGGIVQLTAYSSDPSR
jgi:predicted NBD/HSP70 family sugar kinase